MTVADHLLALTLQGWQFWQSDGRLRYRVPQTATDTDAASSVLATLKPHKDEILKLLQEQPNFLEISPLSFSQKSLWFLWQLEPESWAYNVSFAGRLLNANNIQTWQKSFEQLIERHPTLRSRFSTLDGQPYQQILDVSILDFRVIDSMNWDEAKLQQELLSAHREPFNLGQGPILRVKCFLRPSQELVLFLSVHHIVCDGWSLNLLLAELPILYQKIQEGDTLLPTSHSYREFVSWQQDLLGGDQGIQLSTYWQEKLQGELPILQLPTDHPHPEVQTYNGESQPFLISAELTQQLKTLAEANRVSLYTLLLSAYQILLYRYAGQDDIIIGSPVANRNSSKFASIVGHFVNMLPMRSKLAGEVSFTEHLRQTQQTVLEALDHQDFPFALMVERLQIQRDTRYSPIFQSTFVLQKSEHARLLFELEEGAIEDWQGLQLVPHGLPLNEGQFDLSLEMIELDSGLVGMLRYNKDLFKPDTVTRMLGHFQTLLVGITTYPQEQIDRLPLITATETQQLLVDWNDTSKDYPRHQCIHQLFETQVERTPNAIAIVLDNQQLTYQELNHQANSLAQYLLSLGVGPEILVGICVERSLEMVVGMLGILKAGGSYVPLDPAYPPERLAYMIEDSKLPFLLTEEFLSTQFSNQSVKLVLLDYDWHTIAQCATENPKSPVSVKNLAYTIYTSGSTGKPKGVQLCHASVVNFLYSMQEKPGLTPDDCLLAVTTISFDISVLELFLPLITGARVVLATQEIAADAIQLSTLLAQSGATVMQATPATWQMLIAGGWQGAHGLKILCGGEAISRELADQLLERGSCLWNMYGPTETTVWSAACPIDRERPIRVADPIANTQIYVLGGADPSRNGTASLLPIGVAGEVHIGGEGLARGYLNRPELTQERFIPDPFSHKVGARLYKTGDLACFRPDGSLEFLGRIDNQVKLRGYRIELGEIETALTQHPDVQQAVVIAREDNPGDKRLVSYLIAATTELPTTSDLRSFLQQRLPDYMIPSAFVQLETFPLTPNGKVDRRGFPKPDISAIQAPTAYIAPRNSTEQQMAEIWSKTLKLGQVGIQDDFFELGGHSLLATQVISQIRDSFAVNLSLRSLFEAPTIAGLCDRIEALRWASLQTPALEEDSADDYVEGVL